ncbi:MAG: T9SS type A sorting domain-containing protein [Bacteroidota bacterium]|nr:T9SS type A sorting domain-containing protein [Bacteroidota bacterium]
MIKKQLTVIFALITLNTNAQFEWVAGFGNTGGEIAESVTVDPGGNSISTGFFSGSVDFDPGPGIYNLTGGGAFITKLTSTGNLLWAKKLNGFVSGKDITTDTAGNIYITGTFSGGVDFNPDFPTAYMSTSGDNDVFVLKFDPSGNFEWVLKPNGSAGMMMDDEGKAIHIDNDGNVCIAGIFFGTADFDPGVSSSTMTASAGGSFFMWKISNSGNYIFSKCITASSGEHNISISSDADNNVYTTGYFENTVDLDPGAPVNNYTAVASCDLFILKLNTSGDFVWVKTIGGNQWDAGYDIFVNSLDEVCVVGKFGGTVDFDPGAAIYNLNGGLNSEVFILKLDSAGNFIWAKNLSGYENDNGYSITCDQTGNVYTTGFFADTVDFDPSSGVMEMISKGDRDIFIEKLDSDGNFIWAKQIGGPMDDFGTSITTDASGSLYLAGTFQDTVDFNPDGPVFNLECKGNYDAFVLKLGSSSTSVLEEPAFAESFLIYPNPGSGVFNVKISEPDEIYTLEVYNSLGALIHSQSLSQYQNTTDLSKFSEGIYFVRLVKGKRITGTSKIIIQR